jgi:hypothetical protein
MQKTTFVINPGDVIFVNNRDGNFLSKAIRFFTGSPWSHCALGFFNQQNGEQTIFEANLTVSVTPWERTAANPHYDVMVYRWLKHARNAEKAMWSVYHKYVGNTYGWAQLFWFMWRWMVTGLHLPARWAHKNFFPDNEICSEVEFVGMLLTTDSPIVVAAINIQGYDQNAVHPGDILKICQNLEGMGVMKKVYERVEV